MLTTITTTTLSTGVRLRYVEHGRPGGHPVVLLHGFTDSSYSFSPLLPELAQERYHAFAIDQRGHGDSDRPATGYTTEDLAADVVAFLDALGLDRVSLVGHSMGSFVARRVAEEAPERVDRLVLIGSAVSPVNEGTLELQAAVRTLDDPVPAEFAREFQESTAHRPLPKQFLERAVGESLKVPARVWQSALDGLIAVDHASGLGRIVAPTHVLAGRNETVFSVTEHDELAAAIGATLCVYPETGHAVHWERPHWVARDIDAFLRDGADQLVS